MSKMTVKISGKKVVIDTNRPRVANALAALVEACAERRFGIGEILDHTNGEEYQLVRIKQANGSLRAYLINTDTGRARNSRKVVMVQTDDTEFPHGYVTDIPAEYDKFIDPENPEELLDL